MMDASQHDSINQKQSSDLARVLDQVLQTVRPEVAEAIQLCAVVQYFDEPMLIALRGDPTNIDRIFRRLVRFTFIDELSLNKFALHEKVRTNLLQKWGDKPDEFLEFNKRALAEFDRRIENGYDEEIQIQRIYHKLVIDENKGISEFEAFFSAAEINYQIELCEYLVSVLEEVGVKRATIDYYNSRLEFAVGFQY